MLRATSCFVVLLALVLTACGDDSRPPPPRDGGSGTPDGSTPDVAVDAPAPSCTPGETSCFGSVFFTCGADGMTRENEMTCNGFCDRARGCLACEPGSRQCDGDQSMVCNAVGTGFVTARDCSENGSTCGSNGFCNDECGFAESSRSNVGCEYWPTPLTNISELAGRYDFRAVVANPNDSEVNVRVFRGASEIETITVPARGLQDIVLPWVPGQSDAVQDPERWNSVVATNGAYRLVSSLPVTVSQFNPFEYDNGRGEDFSFSNDASLLLPAHSFTGDYVVSSFTPLSRNITQSGILGEMTTYGKQPGYLTIVGVTPEPTNVQVSVSANVAADAGGRFPATSRGSSLSLTLARGEVATIFAAPPPNCGRGRPGYFEESEGLATLGYCNEFEYDLTGSRVSAENPVAVFGAHMCAFVPYNRFACDHLENQLPPLQTWGAEYVSVPLGDTGRVNRNVVRIMAAFEGTTVTLDPPLEGITSFNLGLGQWREFTTDQAFTVRGSRGILVTQFMVGQNESEPAAERGDPAMVVLPPVEQFRSDYTFVAPTSYNAGTQGQNYILVIRAPGQNITLDGAPVPGTFRPLGGREWGVVAIDGGTHQMVSDRPFGVIAYGLGQFTSYAYPAGLNLEEILLL